MKPDITRRELDVLDVCIEELARQFFNTGAEGTHEELREWLVRFGSHWPMMWSKLEAKRAKAR